jgi:hypothetical protein
MSVTTKNRNVYFGAFTPAMRRMLQVVWDVNDTHQYNLIITSANDSVHAKNSRHYTNEALDLRTHNLQSPEEVQMILKSKLGHKFTVLYEYPGLPNAHIHMQPAKGTVYTLDDLQEDSHVTK